MKFGILKVKNKTAKIHNNNLNTSALLELLLQPEELAVMVTNNDDGADITTDVVISSYMPMPTNNRNINLDID